MENFIVRIISLVFCFVVLDIPYSMAELYKFEITPQAGAKLNSVPISCGVLVGHADDIVSLAKRNILSHCSCETVLMSPDSPDFAASVLKPMTPTDAYNVSKGTVLIELPGIGIDLPLPRAKGILDTPQLVLKSGSSSICDIAISDRLASACPNKLPSSDGSGAEPPSIDDKFSFQLNEEDCKLDEFCVSVDGDLSMLARCGSVSMGISNNGESTFGAGPISITIQAP
jgi:hypothetical protein